MYEVFYPGCEVKVDENDELQIFVPYDPMADIPHSDNCESKPVANASRVASSKAAFTPKTYYAPEGGIFKGYINTDPNMTWPYAVIYFGKDQTADMIIYREKQNVFNYVVDEYGADAVSAVITAVLAKYGVKLTHAGVVMGAALGLYKFVKWVDKQSFIKARDQSSDKKAYVVKYLTPQGITVNVYSPWSGNYVSETTSAITGSPRFYRGEYK